MTDTNNHPLPRQDLAGAYANPAQDAAQSAGRFCARCSTPIDGNDRCTDVTCPFSDYPQNDARGWSNHPHAESAHVEIPDVLYAVSARVERRDSSGYAWTVDLPTFYLDSRVQGITGEEHASQIVRNMIHKLGHDRGDIYVQACATLAPISDRSGS